MLSAVSSNLTKADPLRLAVASNFVETARELANRFTHKTGHPVSISSGSSGKLFLQITNGAPFDVFMSADEQKPALLIKSGDAIPGSQKTYANGQLYLWTKQTCKEQAKNFTNNIFSESIQKMATANPKLAPYGESAKQFLINRNLWTKLKDKLIFPENIGQVAQVAKIGVVDAAIISGSHATSLRQQISGCFRELEGYPTISQDLVILKRAKDNPLARQFIDFLFTRENQNRIKIKGYSPPTSVKMGKE